MKEHKPSVSIIVLNYNGYCDTVECIESISKIKYDNYNIIIVDNNSNDGSKENLVLLKNERTEIIFCDSNTGYAGGNNIGIRKAIQNGSDYICLLNNDVEVTEDFLDVLVNYMEEHPNVGICSPMICEYNQRNKVQSSGCSINYWTGETPFFNYMRDVNEVENSIITCDYVGGACMVFKSQVVKEIGYIPEVYFLFYEETEWCSKIKKKGYRIICNCFARVYHKGSVAVNKKEGLKEHYMCRNRVLFIRRNSSRIQKVFFYVYIIIAMFVNALVKGQWKRMLYYFEGLFWKEV